MEKLRRLRTERRLSQARLAARAELDPSTVNQIERGAREASPATLRKLAEALDVGLAELLEDVSPKVDRRLSLEPSLWNGLDDEGRASIFLDAVAAAADRLNALAADPDMNNGRRFGIGDAALALGDAMHERVTEEVWQTLSNKLRLELIDIAEKLLQVATQSIEHAEDERREVEAYRARERIREWTMRISA